MITSRIFSNCVKSLLLDKVIALVLTSVRSLTSKRKYGNGIDEVNRNPLQEFHHYCWNKTAVHTCILFITEFLFLFSQRGISKCFTIILGRMKSMKRWRYIFLSINKNECMPVWMFTKFVLSVFFNYSISLDQMVRCTLWTGLDGFWAEEGGREESYGVS